MEAFSFPALSSCAAGFIAWTDCPHVLGSLVSVMLRQTGQIRVLAHLCVLWACPALTY